MSALPEPEHDQSRNAGMNPYAAPDTESAAPEEASVAAAEDRGYKNQDLVVLVLTALLVVQAGLGAFKGGACVVLNTATLAPEMETTAVTATEHVATAMQYLYYATMLPFGMFLVRSNKNARVFGMASIAYTPGSMVWWFCVPLLNLVRPYQAVKAVWDGSAPTEGDVVSTTDGNVVLFWWVAWLGEKVGSQLANFMLSGASVQLHNNVLAIDAVSMAALCALALRMIRALHARQQRRAAEADVVESGSRFQPAFE